MRILVFSFILLSASIANAEGLFETNGLFLDREIVSYFSGSGVPSGDIDLQGSKVTDTTQGIHLGNGGTPGSATNAHDVYVEQILEVDGTSFFDAMVTVGDAIKLCLGADCDYWAIYDNSQFELWTTDADGGGADGLVLSVDDGGKTIDFGGAILISANGSVFGGWARWSDNENIYFGTGNNYWLRYTSGSSSLSLHTTDADGSSTNGTIFSVADGHSAMANAPYAVTIADSGDGNPATSSVTPRSNYVELTCNDADTCDITIVETGVLEGTRSVIVNVSANTCDFADQAGVLELDGGAAFAMTQLDSLEILYTGGEWIELRRMDID